MDARITSEEAASLLQSAAIVLQDLRVAKKNDLMFDDETLKEVKRLKKSLEELLLEASKPKG
jgi:hypothetical protein